MQRHSAMEELRQILRLHGQRYPLMQPTDAVKLIYQNEFGGGHLIKDPAAFFRYLSAEYEAVKGEPTNEKYELLGNGVLRIHLRALRPEELAPLGRAFLRSAAEHRGSVESFRQKLTLLEDLTREGIFSFDLDALWDCLTDYEKLGFPMISHSLQYREAYRPAYRIITESYSRIALISYFG